MIKRRQKSEIRSQNIILVISLLIFLSGCEQPCSCQNGGKASLTSESFGIADIRPVALSKITTEPDAKSSHLKLIVEVFDKYANRIKTPFILRVELYAYESDVPKNMGKRLKLWEDIDLTGHDTNHNNWNDFLRCYEFDLDIGFAAEKNRSFVILLTCFGASGELLIKDFVLTAP